MEYKKETLKILIVDDCEIDLDILESILMQLGFQKVIKSGSAKEGLRLVKEYRPDLVFTDILMPEVDGGEFRRLLKENIATMDIPVIFISSIITKKDEKKDGGRLVTKDLIVSKPLSIDRIAEVIDVALKDSSKE